MDDLKAIETSYHGCRFRSRLEARWAVFFDSMGIEWSYETEGMALSSGAKYLPDFVLYNFEGRGPSPSNDYAPRENVLYCEVKGVQNREDLLARKQDDYDRIWEFGQNHPTIILPNIPEDIWDWWSGGVSNFETVDFDFFPCAICHDNLPFSDPKYFVLCGPDGGSFPDEYLRKETTAALKKARSARFEFTEQDLEPLEHEVEVLQKRVDLQNKKNELIKQLTGGNK